jgi:hypothetical protein
LRFPDELRLRRADATTRRSGGSAKTPGEWPKIRLDQPIDLQTGMKREFKSNRAYPGRVRAG